MNHLLRKLALFLPLFLVMVGANYRLDPAHLFHGREYAAIARMLLDGQNVANLLDFDERLLQRHYLEGMTEGKEVVVFGSSRTQQVRADCFPGRRFFNSSVNHGSLRDYLALYELYIRTGREPRLVVLSLDPWLLDPSQFPIRFSLGHEYQAARQRLGLALDPDPSWWEEPSPVWLQLFSPSYLQSGVFSRLWGGYYSTHETLSEVRIKLCDGSVSYDRSWHRRTAGQVRRIAVAFGPRDAGVGTCDPQLARELEAFVDMLLARGVKVLFLLTPYHPATYANILASDKAHALQQVQSYYEKLALSRGIKLVGSYDPAALSCSESDFFDGVHPKPEAMCRLLRRSPEVRSSSSPQATASP